MRFLKVAFAGLVTALAMLASLMVALAVAVAGLVIFLFLRMRGRKSPGPLVGHTPGRPTGHADSDVIEVTATEVRSTRLER